MCAETYEVAEEVYDYIALVRDQYAQEKTVFIKAALNNAIALCNRLAEQIQGEADGSIAPPEPEPVPVVVEKPKSAKGKKTKKVAAPPPKPSVPKFIPAPKLEPTDFKVLVSVHPDTNIIKISDNGFGYGKDDLIEILTTLNELDGEVSAKLKEGATEEERGALELGLLGVLVAAQKFDLITKCYKDSPYKISYAAGKTFTFQELKKCQLEFGSELILYFKPEDKDLLNTVAMNEYVGANVQTGDVTVEIPFVECEKVKIRNFFEKLKPTDKVIEFFDLSLPHFREAIDCYLGLLWPDNKDIPEVAFIRQFKGKSVKKGSYLEYVNENDLRKYKSILLEIRGEPATPNYGEYADEYDQIKPLLEANKDYLPNGRVICGFDENQVEDEQQVREFVSLNEVLQTPNAFPQVDEVIRVLVDQAKYLEFYKKFDKLTCKRFEILFDAIQCFCKYYYAQKNNWPLKKGLESIYIKNVVNKFGQDNFEKQFLIDLLTEVKVPKIGLKRGLLTQERIFFEGDKVAEEGSEAPEGFDIEYKLSGENLLAYCMALLALSGYAIDHEAMKKPVEEKMLIFPGFCSKDRQAAPIRPIYVELKKEEE